VPARSIVPEPDSVVFAPIRVVPPLIVSTMPVGDAESAGGAVEGMPGVGDIQRGELMVRVPPA